MDKDSSYIDDPYSTRIPVQYRKGEFSSYYGGRKNGWIEHPLIFNRRISVSDNNTIDTIFGYNDRTGEIKILMDDFIIKIEVWWLGNAPFEYQNVSIIKNLNFEGYGDISKVIPKNCTLSNEECIKQHRNKYDIGNSNCPFNNKWGSSHGHIVAYVTSKKHDKYSILNLPAHIQGTPSQFELSIYAYKPIINLSTTLMLSNQSKIDELINAIKDCRIEDIKSIIINDNLSCCFQCNSNGETNIETLLANINKYLNINDIYDIKKLICTNSFAHSIDVSNFSLCWSCKSPLLDIYHDIELNELKRIKLEDELLYDNIIKSGDASLNRGVCVKWLVNFTNTHNCWNWPTWRVAINIIKPATAHSRVRYVHLPGIASAANVGEADIFISHTWGGRWGDLVSAALSSINEGNENNKDTITRVWIDLFAVRQWNGNILDICFPNVVKQVKCVLVIVSTSELQRVSELRYKSIMDNGIDLLNNSERRSIPFMRTWCLAEINSAVEFNIPLIIACGKYKIDTNCTDMYKRYIFETNTPLLYNLQFLVFIEKSEAQFEEDRIRILNEVINGIGIDHVNDAVKGAIISSMYSSKCHCIRLAVLGFMDFLNNEIEKWNVNKSENDLFDSLVACCIGGYIDLFNYIINKTCTFDKILNIFLLIKDEDGLTLLVHSIRSGKVKMVNILISLGSNVNEVSNDSWSPLLYAIEFGNIELIKILINAGADIYFESRSLLSPLSFSCQTGNLKCCEYLLTKCNCDIESREGVGYTNLCLATKFNKINLMKYLINKGADCNARDNWGKSIINWAFDTKRLDVMQELLLSSDIDINIAIFTKEKVLTVLDLAVEYGDNDLINLLKKYNASTLMELHLKFGHIQVNEKDLNRLIKDKGLDIKQAGLIYMTIPIGYNTLIERNYPKIGEIVNMNEIKKPSNIWTNGIVTKGPHWNIEENEDSVNNNEYKYGYIVKLIVEDLKVIVYWPLAKIKCLEHRVGYENKYDLVYTY